MRLAMIAPHIHKGVHRERYDKVHTLSKPATTESTTRQDLLVAEVVKLADMSKENHHKLTVLKGELHTAFDTMEYLTIQQDKIRQQLDIVVQAITTGAEDQVDDSAGIQLPD